VVEVLVEMLVAAAALARVVFCVVLIVKTVVFIDDHLIILLLLLVFQICHVVNLKHLFFVWFELLKLFYVNPLIGLMGY